MSQKIFLLVPFEIKDNLKETEKILYDPNRKLWYCEVLTKGLEQYEMRYVDIHFMERDIWKPKLKSMKWLKDEKSWVVNGNDYKIYSSQ